MRFSSKSNDVRLVPFSSAFVVLGEPALNCLDFSMSIAATSSIGSDVNGRKVALLSDYVRAVTKERKSAFFETPNVVKRDAVGWIVAICSPLCFSWYDEETRLSIKTALKAVNRSFDALSEKLRFYHATFDVLPLSAGDARDLQSAALNIIGRDNVNAYPWQSVLRDYRAVVLSRRADEKDEIVEALRKDAHEEKNNL